MKVVFDLDGTLANCDHRQHLVKAGKWDAYFDACDKDTPIFHAIVVLKALLRNGHLIEIWSGRGEGPGGAVRDKTTEWLKEHDIWNFIHALRMRPHKDHRKDSELKTSWWKEAGKPDLVFEDRDQAVKMWRDAGVPCYQVAPGDF